MTLDKAHVVVLGPAEDAVRPASSPCRRDRRDLDPLASPRPPGPSTPALPSSPVHFEPPAAVATGQAPGDARAARCWPPAAVARKAHEGDEASLDAAMALVQALVTARFDAGSATRESRLPCACQSLKSCTLRHALVVMPCLGGDTFSITTITKWSKLKTFPATWW